MPKDLDLVLATLADETAVLGGCLIVSLEDLQQLPAEAVGTVLTVAARCVETPLGGDLPEVDWEWVTKELGVLEEPDHLLAAG